MSKNEHLTVEGLINIQEKMPSDIPVLTHGFKEHYDNILEPVVKSVKYNEENEDFFGMYELCDKGEKNSIEALIFFRDGRWS